MIWTYSEHQDVYIAVAGAYRCRIYHERAGTWMAIVLHQATAIVQEDFPRAERAMVWCEHCVRQAA